MANPDRLIRTKLHPPTLGTDTIPRDVLYARLDAERDRPLCLVCAAAGYGKSTTIADWLRRAGTVHAWVSLDERDNDLRLFLSYVVEALQAGDASAFADTAAMLEAPALPLPEDLATVFVNELARLPHPPVLVLDDYHQISVQDIHDFVWRIVEHPAPDFRLVLTSRRDPPLPLVRLRANARLSDIRARDLRFDLSEARRFIEAAAHRTIAGSVLEHIHRSTEGWAAGLRLAGAVLRDHADDFALRGGLDSHQDVRDYLLEEVFAQQEPALREGLLELSVLERFSAAIAGEVLSVPASDLMLQIARAGLPVVSLDERGEWVRFHHLFGHFLRERLNQSRNASQVADLHLRAMAAFESRGLLDEAFAHALDGGGEAVAAALLVRQRSAVMRAELWSSLDRWIRRLGPTATEEPGLLTLQWWMFQNRGRYAEGFALLERIERRLAQDPHLADDYLQGEVAALRCRQCIAESRPDEAVSLAERALTLLPESCYSERGYAAVVRVGGLQLAGRLARAKSVAYEALADPRLPAGTTYHCRLLMGLGLAYWMEGDGPSIAQVGAECLELGERHELPESAVIGRYLVGIHLYQRNALDEAVRTLGPLDSPAAAVNAEFHAHAMMALAAARHAAGEANAALHLIDRLNDHLLRTGNTIMLVTAESFRSQLWIARGEIDRAMAWLKAAAPFPLVPQYLFHSPLLVPPRVLMAEASAASLDAANDHLDRVEPYLRALHNIHFLVEALGLRACLLGARGDDEGAESALREALRLAQPGGMVRVLADIGPALDAPLAALADDPKIGGLATTVRHALLRGAAPAPAAAAPGHAPPPDSLTRREMEVLELLVQRFSNKEIANRLSVSPATVKRHSENLYSKLGAKGRRDVAARAAEMGLIKRP